MLSCLPGQTVLQSCRKIPGQGLQQFAFAAVRPVGLAQCRAASSRHTGAAAVPVPAQVVERDGKTEVDLALLERVVSSSGAERPDSTPALRQASKQPEEQLTSTSGHRAIVASAFLLLAAVATSGLAGVHSPNQAVECVAAAATAYVLAGDCCSLPGFTLFTLHRLFEVVAATSNATPKVHPQGCHKPANSMFDPDFTSTLCLSVLAVSADFGTGVYHWSVDNYGSGATPIVGDQIAAFQGHHQRPWTITQRQFANNLHKVQPSKMHLSCHCNARHCVSLKPH